MPIDDTEHLLSSEKNAGRLVKSMAQFRYRSSITGRFIKACIAKLLPWFSVRERREK